MNLDLCQLHQIGICLALSIYHWSFTAKEWKYEKNDISSFPVIPLLHAAVTDMHTSLHDQFSPLNSFGISRPSIILAYNELPFHKRNVM